MIRALLDIFLTLFAPSASNFTRVGGGSGELRSRRNAFDSHLKRLVADGSPDAPPLIAGSLELLGLDDVRAALGPNWPAVADRARRLAELELQRHLDPADLYRPHGDGLFLVCFATLGKAEANHKANEIAASIRSRLVAEIPEIADALQVEHFIAEVDRVSLRDGKAPVADGLLQALKKVRIEAENAARQFKASLLRNVQVTFCPAWNASRQMVVFNRCLLDVRFDGDSADKLSDAHQLERTLTELDLVLLTRSVEALHKVQSNKRSGLFLVPVTFRTANETQSLEEYTRLLALVPESYRKYLMLEICAVPASASPQRLGELVTALSPFAKGLSLELSLNYPHPHEVVDQHPWAIAISLPSAGEGISPHLTAELRNTVEMARLAGVNALAHGANSVGLALAATEAGFTYIDGSAIHPSVREPKRPSPLSPFPPVPVAFKLARRV